MLHLEQYKTPEQQSNAGAHRASMPAAVSPRGWIKPE
jgi:hypothetical protein